MIALGLGSAVLLTMAQYMSFLIYPGIAALIAVIIVDIRYWNCPHCGRNIGRFHGDYCKNCGEKLDI